MGSSSLAITNHRCHSATPQRAPVDQPLRQTVVVIGVKRSGGLSLASSLQDRGCGRAGALPVDPEMPWVMASFMVNGCSP